MDRVRGDIFSPNSLLTHLTWDQVKRTVNPMNIPGTTQSFYVVCFRSISQSYLSCSFPTFKQTYNLTNSSCIFQSQGGKALLIVLALWAKEGILLGCLQGATGWGWEYKSSGYMAFTTASGGGELLSISKSVWGGAPVYIRTCGRIMTHVLHMPFLPLTPFLCHSLNFAAELFNLE